MLIAIVTSLLITTYLIGVISAVIIDVALKGETSWKVLLNPYKIFED